MIESRTRNTPCLCPWSSETASCRLNLPQYQLPRSSESKFPAMTSARKKPRLHRPSLRLSLSASSVQLMQKLYRVPLLNTFRIRAAFAHFSTPFCSNRVRKQPTSESQRALDAKTTTICPAPLIIVQCKPKRTLEVVTRKFKYFKWRTRETIFDLISRKWCNYTVNSDGTYR